MEPGQEGREDNWHRVNKGWSNVPQWSPAEKAGKTIVPTTARTPDGLPQWSPAEKAGKTHRGRAGLHVGHVAAMEPGREGREDR